VNHRLTVFITVCDVLFEVQHGLLALLAIIRLNGAILVFDEPSPLLNFHFSITLGVPLEGPTF
jgi:hypothetical protein